MRVAAQWRASTCAHKVRTLLPWLNDNPRGLKVMGASEERYSSIYMCRPIYLIKYAGQSIHPITQESRQGFDRSNELRHLACRAMGHFRPLPCAGLVFFVPFYRVFWARMSKVYGLPSFRAPVPTFCLCRSRSDRTTLSNLSTTRITGEHSQGLSFLPCLCIRHCALLIGYCLERLPKTH